LVAHDEAVYDISFSLEPSVFATVGEDGSVRSFDIRELRNSNIVYEHEQRVPLTHVKWNLQDPNQMAVVAEDDTNVLLFDKRRPS
jgi:DDB1- and CUL4-associated factor 7